MYSSNDELYNKYSLSTPFIRWCGIHPKDTKKFGILDGLVNDSEYYTEDFEYSDKGNVAIAEQSSRWIERQAYGTEGWIVKLNSNRNQYNDIRKIEMSVTGSCNVGCPLC